MRSTTDATQELYARLLPIFQEVHLLAEGMAKHTNRDQPPYQAMGRLLSWCRDTLLEVHQLLADEESLPGDLEDWLTFDLPVLDLALMRAAEAPADPFPVRLHVNRVGAVVPSLVYFADMARVYCQQRLPAGAEQSGEVVTVTAGERSDAARAREAMKHVKAAVKALEGVTLGPSGGILGRAFADLDGAHGALGCVLEEAGEPEPEEAHV